MKYPDDATLIARGQYSTLTDERRRLLRSLRDHAEATTENGRRILRVLEDVVFGAEQVELAAQHVAEARQIMTRIAELDTLRAELRSAAWGTQKEIE